jgi:hypothetical protein
LGDALDAHGLRLGLRETSVILAAIIGTRLLGAD